MNDKSINVLSSEHVNKDRTKNDLVSCLFITYMFVTFLNHVPIANTMALTSRRHNTMAITLFDTYEYYTPQILPFQYPSSTLFNPTILQLLRFNLQKPFIFIQSSVSCHLHSHSQATS